MSIVYRKTALLVSGLLTACPSQPVPGDTETDTETDTATTTGSGSDATSNGSVPTGTTTSDEPTGTTGTTTTTGDTSTSTGDTTTTTGETSTTDAVSVTETETTTTTTGAETTTTTGPDTSTSTGEETSTSTGPDTSTTSTTSTTGENPECGDGVLQPGEACDDGNQDGDDGCLPTCELGMGAPLPPLVIPGAMPEDLRCMAPLPGWFLDAAAMIIGRALPNFGPEGQTASQLFEVSLPWGSDPAFWEHTELSGDDGRIPLQALQSVAQGRVVVAGLVDTEAQMPGSGGHLWLSSVGGDGTVEYVKEFADIPIAVADIAQNSFGDLAAVGDHAGAGAGAWVLRFDFAGELVWQHPAPIQVGWTVHYRGTAIDEDGVIYAVGERHAEDASADELFLEALSPEGTVLWEVTQPSPTHAHALPSDVALTSPGVLSVAMSQFDSDVLEDSVLGYAQFTTDGAQTWWKEWAPADGWSVRAGPVDVEPFGGLFVGVGEHEDGMARTRVLRIDKDGAVLWASKSPGGDVRDLLFTGPPERVYALTKDAIIPFESW